MESLIYYDDCFNKFKDIPDKSVQLVCVDLPYNQIACDFDKEIIDLEKMWVELKRILKPNGQALFFCTTKFGIKLINSNPKWFRYDIVWEKARPIGHLIAKKSLMKKHEMIYLFHNSTKPRDLNWIYNPQMIKGEPYKGRSGTYRKNIYGDKAITSHNTTGDRFPSTIIKYPSPTTNKLHPTQKPVEMCEWLIKTYSNEGDVVMDFTMGSGSTIVACINTNRTYIGIEKDEKYFKIAEQRINETLQNI